MLFTESIFQDFILTIRCQEIKIITMQTFNQQKPLVAYSRGIPGISPGTGRFSQFCQEPLPQIVPGNFLENPVPRTVPQEFPTRFNSQNITRHFFAQKSLILNGLNERSC